MSTRWKRIADALLRLAEEQRGKPEGDLARAKLAQIIAKYPEARDYEPLQMLLVQMLTPRDIADMRRRGVNTDGSWTGRDLREALLVMAEDLRKRRASPWIEYDTKQKIE